MAAEPLKKTKKLWSPPSSSLTCLPDEIILECLVHVRRRDYENLSCVSKRLRSLVRSPELHRMRSRLHKDPVYICIWERDNYSTDPTYLWFTLRRTTTEYKLVPIPLPSRYFMFRASTVAVDSEIYFVGGHPKATELWILDTRSGKLRQGPIMPKPRSVARSAVGVADGKMYVTQELKNGSIGEEVFHIQSQTWKDAGAPVPDEKVCTRAMVQSSVTLEGKVYAMNIGRITVYNLRQGGRKEKLEMPVDDRVWCICAADNVLFAFFNKCGLMWLDTKRNIWRVVAGRMPRKLYGGAMAEYYGKLAVFWRVEHIGPSNKEEEKIWCAVIAFGRVGEEEVRGTIEWSSVVATIPYVCGFLHCLVASD